MTVLNVRQLRLSLLHLFLQTLGMDNVVLPVRCLVPYHRRIE